METLRPNPRAEQAFADYVAMGPSRSLRALAEAYQGGIKPAPTRKLRTLAEWSTRYRWQERIAKAVTELTEAKMREAAELDAASFLRTSEVIAAISVLMMQNPLDVSVADVVKLRESVRRPVASSTTVHLNLSVDIEVRQIAERIARDRGLDVDDVLAEAMRILDDAKR